MSERENKRVSASPGAVLEWVNETTNAESLTIDCGTYGKIEFNVPIGGAVRFTVGTEPFSVLFNKVETDIFNADNIVRLKSPD